MVIENILTEISVGNKKIFFALSLLGGIHVSNIVYYLLRLHFMTSILKSLKMFIKGGSAVP